MTQADVPPAAARSGDPIAIGQIGVAKGGGVLRTFVGSCVGLVLHVGSQRAAGLAHVMLPASNGRGTPPGKYADTALAELLKQLLTAGFGILQWSLLPKMIRNQDGTIFLLTGLPGWS